MYVRANLQASLASIPALPCLEGCSLRRDRVPCRRGVLNDREVHDTEGHIMTKERVLSGMRSSGKPHLGNLLGALKNWVQLQETYECFYFIADWHALTTGYADTAQN